MESTVSFGYWIRRQRKALDLTQQVLAEKVGCSLVAINRSICLDARTSHLLTQTEDRNTFAFNRVVAQHPHVFVMKQWALCNPIRA